LDGPRDATLSYANHIGPHQTADIVPNLRASLSRLSPAVVYLVVGVALVVLHASGARPRT
jgi:hypothetical protein